jgi:hypothetical protein
MAFQNPAALWLLLLLPLPFFVSRPPSSLRRREVANLYLWQRIIDRDQLAAGPRPMRTRLIALLQAACIGTLAISIARPIVAVDGPRAAIVVDVSATMATQTGGESRLDEARERARGVLRNLARTTRVTFVAAGRLPRRIGDAGAHDVRVDALLALLTPSSGTADLASAIRAAQDEGIGHGDVFIVTDRPRPGRATTPSGIPADHWIRVGKPVENIAITRLVAARPSSNNAVPVLVEVTNQGERDRDVEIVLAVDGRPDLRTTVRVPSHAAVSHTDILRRRGRVLSARVTFDDALATDNVRYAAFGFDPVRVAILGRRHPFVEKALETNPRVRMIRDAGEPFDVAVCDACGAPDADAVLAIDSRDVALRGSAVTVERPDHPVVSAIDTAALFVDLAAPAGTSTADGVVLARAGGQPAVVAAEREGRRTVRLAFDVDAPATALGVAFPVLIANAVDWLAAGATPRQLLAGEPLILSERTGRSAQVTGPDGRPRAVRTSGRVRIVDDTDLPGVYRLRTTRGDDEFVVNTAVSEVNPVEDDDSPVGDDTRDTLHPTRTLSSALLIAALGMFAAEWACRGRFGHAR